MAKKTKKYGSWTSPITVAAISAGRNFADVQWAHDGETLIWQESNQGKTNFVIKRKKDAPREMLSDLSPRGGVSYAAGEMGMGDEAVTFPVKGGAIYRKQFVPGSAELICEPGGGSSTPRLSPDGRFMIFIHTDGTVDHLMLVDLKDKSMTASTSGADFYFQPVWSPQGDKISWVEWDHPNMPWDESRIVVREFDAKKKALGKVIFEVKGKRKAVFQPEFSPSGKQLAYIITKGDWDELRVFDFETLKNKSWLAIDAHLMQPNWVPGKRTFGWHADGQRISIIAEKAGECELLTVTEAGSCEVILTPQLEVIDKITISQKTDRIAIVGESSTQEPRVMVWDGKNWRVKAYATALTIDPAYLSQPVDVQWKSLDGSEIYGLYYPPPNPLFRSKGLPPLLVWAHGGPTAPSARVYDLELQYFTSRGYAVLAVNYRGSTSYGNRYRDALLGEWGRADSEDCVSAVAAMAEQGLADPAKCAIWGGSAGGLTVLNALTDHPGVFKARVARYAVTNLFTLEEETHKFEAHYLRGLVGALPKAKKKYQERSPLFKAERIKDKVLFLHGDEDNVVPLSQTQEIFDKLQSLGIPAELKVYAGEGHGFKLGATYEDMYPRVERFLRESLDL